MTRSRVLAPAILLFCVVLMSCDDTKTPPSPTPTPTPTPTVSPAPQAFRIQITAPRVLTSVGDSVRLSLTASFADGTSRDVAAEAAWTVDMPSVVQVTSGEATALSLGKTSLYARFNALNAYTSIQVTPPGTFAVLGGAREPGSSGLSGVTVSQESSGFATTTNVDGYFTLGGLTDRTLLFQKSGFENSPHTLAPDEEFPWVAMQRILRVQDGQTISTRIAPHDMDYIPAYASVQGEHCSPCKLIRLSNTPGARMRITVKWTPAAVGLWLWTDDGTFASSSPGQIVIDMISNSAETWLYVGQKPAGAAMQYLDVQVAVARVATPIDR